MSLNNDNNNVNVILTYTISTAVDVPVFQSFNSVLSILSYLCKAPLVEKGGRVVNALFKQRASIENLLRSLLSLPPINHMDLQYKCSDRSQWHEELKQPIRKEKEFETRPIAPIINGVLAGH